MHVDAAYAGSSWVCPELRWSQAGVERADSLVINAHKWLFTPMDCSLLWTRRPEALRGAFSLVPEYLRTSDEAESLSDYGPALGRRFRSLKLWAVLRCYGREGLQARIREAVRLAELFEGLVGAEPEWEVCAPRHFSLVCFRREGSDDDNEELLARVKMIALAEPNTRELPGAPHNGARFLQHTRLMRYPDTIDVEVFSAGETRSTLAIYSRSLIGRLVDLPTAHAGGVDGNRIQDRQALHELRRPV